MPNDENEWKGFLKKSSIDYREKNLLEVHIYATPDVTSLGMHLLFDFEHIEKVKQGKSLRGW